MAAKLFDILADFKQRTNAKFNVLSFREIKPVPRWIYFMPIGVIVVFLATLYALHWTEDSHQSFLEYLQSVFLGGGIVTNLYLLAIAMSYPARALLWVRQDLVGNRLYKSQLKQLETADKFVLFLRSFGSDTSKSERSKRSALEKNLVQQVGQHSPVVAIDNVLDPGKTAGAVRIAVEHDWWRGLVETLAEHCRFVVLDCRIGTPGLREEVNLRLNSEKAACYTVFINRNEAGRMGKTVVDIESAAQSNGKALRRFGDGKKSSPAISVLDPAGILHSLHAPMSLDKNMFASIMRAVPRAIDNQLDAPDRVGIASEFLQSIADSRASSQGG